MDDMPACYSTPEKPICNVLYLIGGRREKEKIVRFLEMILANNDVAFGYDDKDEMLIFSTTRMLDLDALLQYSKKYPDVIFFWAWVNPLTSVEGNIRFCNGEVRKKKIKSRKKRSISIGGVKC